MITVWDTKPNDSTILQHENVDRERDWSTCGQHISTSRRIAFCQWPHEPPLIAIFIHHCAGMAFDGMRLRARRTGMESLTPLRQLGTTAKVFLDPHRATFNSTCTSKLTIQNQFHHCCLQSNVHEHIISSTCYFEQCTVQMIWRWN